jgi:hypothetical protein
MSEMTDLTAPSSQWNHDTDEGPASTLEKEVAAQLRVTLDEDEPAPKVEPKVEAEAGENAEEQESQQSQEASETGEVSDEEVAEDVSAKPKDREDTDGQTEETTEPETTLTLEAAEKELRVLLDKLPQEKRTELLGTGDPAFAALTAKTRRVREREEATAARERHVESQLAEAKKTQEELDGVIKQARENPVKALETFGWTFEEAAKFVMNDEKVPEEKRRQFLERAYDERIKNIESKLEADAQRNEKEKQKNAIDGWMVTLKGEVAQAFNGDSHPIAKRIGVDDVSQEVWQLVKP